MRRPKGVWRAAETPARDLHDRSGGSGGSAAEDTRGYAVVEIVLSVVLALVFTGAGGAKLAGQPMMRESATHLGVPWDRYRLIGVLEVAAAVGLLVGLAVTALGVAAAAGLVALMAGAVVFHLRAGDPPARWAPPAVLGVLALVVVVLLL